MKALLTLWCAAVMAASGDPAALAKQAAEHFAAARKSRFPDLAQAWPGVSNDVWDKPRLAQAVDAAQAALKLDPGQRDAAAIALEGLGRQPHTEALEELVRTLPAETFDERVHRALLAGLLAMPSQQEGEGALRIAGRWLERFPWERAARRGVARVWMTAGALDRAMSLVSSWLAGAPDDAEWLALAGTIELLSARPRSARPLLERAAAAGDAGARRLVSLLDAARGEASARAHLTELAGVKVERVDLPEMLVKALARQPGDEAERWKELRNLYERLKDARMYVDAAVAEQALLHAGGWTRWDQRDQLTLADRWRFMREWNREVEALLPLVPDVDRDGKTVTGVSRGDFHFRIGRAMFHAVRLDEALREYLLSSRAGKDDAELTFHIAKIHQQQGRDADARKLFEKATRFKGTGVHIERARKELDKQKSLK